MQPARGSASPLLRWPGGPQSLTCDLLSILPSAPPRPGTQKVLRNCLSSCSCKKPTSFQTRARRTKLVAGYLLYYSFHQAHPTGLTRWLPLSEPKHLGGDRALSQRHQNQNERQAGGVTGFNKPSKASCAFHDPLCKPGGVPWLCHTAGVSPPRSGPRDPGGPRALLAEVGQGRDLSSSRVLPLPTTHLAASPKSWALSISPYAKALKTNADREPRLPGTPPP